MTNLGDKILGFVLGIFVSAFICAMLIFNTDNVSWFEIVKCLATLLVAGAFIITTLTYIRQSEWKRTEDSLEDSKLYCNAAVEGIKESAEKIFKSFKGVEWHIATVHLEESSVVAKNITNQSVRDIYNLKKSVIFNNVLNHIHATPESQFSGLESSEYDVVKSRITELSSNNISTLSELEKQKICKELITYTDRLKECNAIDLSSIVEVCISCALLEHDDVFESQMIHKSYGEISPDYCDDDVLNVAVNFIEKNFNSLSLYFYIKFLYALSDILLKCSIDRREQLIGN